MPLYDFRCVQGHESERLVSMSVETVTCRCGQPAKRQSVYATASPKAWASEFQLPSSARAALDEATGWKREALKAKEEAVNNGWKA